MSDYPPTPVLTRHARERCAEMEISTKVAKAIVRDPDLVRPGNSGTGCVFATSERYPRYAVVYEPGDPHVIVSVVFRTTEPYVREGATCRIEPVDSGKE